MLDDRLDGLARRVLGAQLMGQQAVENGAGRLVQSCHQTQEKTIDYKSSTIQEKTLIFQLSQAKYVHHRVGVEKTIKETASALAHLC